MWLGGDGGGVKSELLVMSQLKSSDLKDCSDSATVGIILRLMTVSGASNSSVDTLVLNAS